MGQSGAEERHAERSEASRVRNAINTAATEGQRSQRFDLVEAREMLRLRSA
jgi:hypothetical protein